MPQQLAAADAAAPTSSTILYEENGIIALLSPFHQRRLLVRSVYDGSCHSLPPTLIPPSANSFGGTFGRICCSAAAAIHGSRVFPLQRRNRKVAQSAAAETGDHQYDSTDTRTQSAPNTKRSAAHYRSPVTDQGSCLGPEGHARWLARIGGSSCGGQLTSMGHLTTDRRGFTPAGDFIEELQLCVLLLKFLLDAVQLLRRGCRLAFNVSLYWRTCEVYGACSQPCRQMRVRPGRGSDGKKGIVSRIEVREQEGCEMDMLTSISPCSSGTMWIASAGCGPRAAACLTVL